MNARIAFLSVQAAALIEQFKLLEKNPLSEESLQSLQHHAKIIASELVNRKRQSLSHLECQRVDSTLRTLEPLFLGRAAQQSTLAITCRESKLEEQLGSATTRASRRKIRHDQNKVSLLRHSIYKSALEDPDGAREKHRENRKWYFKMKKRLL
jgi:hypothetical protein